MVSMTNYKQIIDITKHNISAHPSKSSETGLNILVKTVDFFFVLVVVEN